MSKQNMKKAVVNAPRGSSTQDRNPSTTTRNDRTTRSSMPQNRAAASTRPRSVQSKPGSGFKLRPLDAALILVGVIVVAFIVFTAFQAPVTQVTPGAGVPADAQPVAVGSVAPDLNVQDVNGKRYTLSGARGKVVVMEFMATWCPHCQAETPVYNRLYDDYVAAGKNVEVWGINATQYGHDQKSIATLDDLKWFRDNYNTKYPLLFDQTLKSATDYAILGYPAVYIVDEQGIVVMQPSMTALPTYEELAAKIDEALSN